MSLFAENNLLNMTILNDIWGYSKGGKNLEKAAQAINDNLERFDPMKEVFWTRTQECLRS
jgi:hypothetical protein